MGINIPTSDAIGMGSEEGSSETSPHDFGPTISDFVGDLKIWDNSKDWMLELPGRGEISYSAFRILFF